MCYLIEGQSLKSPVRFVKARRARALLCILNGEYCVLSLQGVVIATLVFHSRLYIHGIRWFTDPPWMTGSGVERISISMWDRGLEGSYIVFPNCNHILLRYPGTSNALNIWYRHVSHNLSSNIAHGAIPVACQKRYSSCWISGDLLLHQNTVTEYRISSAGAEGLNISHREYWYKA